MPLLPERLVRVMRLVRDLAPSHRTAPWRPVIVASLLLVACAQDSVLRRPADRLRAYQSAVRWGQFDQAAAFQDGVSPPRRATDRLRDIRVTDYRVTGRREAPDQRSLHQTVTIRYRHLGEVTERTLIDEQDWRYDAERGDWVVDSAVPDFE